MRRPEFSPAEVALARRIQAKVFSDALAAAAHDREPGSCEDLRGNVLSVHSLRPPKPAWWDRAIAEADHGLLWVEDFGWLPQELWQDLISLTKADPELFDKERT